MRSGLTFLSGSLFVLYFVVIRDIDRVLENVSTDIRRGYDSTTTIIKPTPNVTQNNTAASTTNGIKPTLNITHNNTAASTTTDIKPTLNTTHNNTAESTTTDIKPTLNITHNNTAASTTTGIKPTQNVTHNHTAASTTTSIKPTLLVTNNNTGESTTNTRIKPTLLVTNNNTAAASTNLQLCPYGELELYPPPIAQEEDINAVRKKQQQQQQQKQQEKEKDLCGVMFRPVEFFENGPGRPFHLGKLGLNYWATHVGLHYHILEFSNGYKHHVLFCGLMKCGSTSVENAFTNHFTFEKVQSFYNYKNDNGITSNDTSSTSASTVPLVGVTNYGLIWKIPNATAAVQKLFVLQQQQQQQRNQQRRRKLQSTTSSHNDTLALSSVPSNKNGEKNGSNKKKPPRRKNKNNDNKPTLLLQSLSETENSTDINMESYEFFATIRDPVKRFVSATAQEMYVHHSGYTKAIEFRKKCLKETSRETLRCSIEHVQDFFSGKTNLNQPHFIPYSVVLYRRSFKYNITIRIFPMEMVDTLVHTFAMGPPPPVNTTNSQVLTAPAARMNTHDGEGKSQGSDILSSLSVKDLTEDMVQTICKMYEVDVLMMNSLGMETMCDDIPL